MNRAEIAEAYLQAIGLRRIAPSLEFLSEIAERHVDRLPFSSVGVRLGEELPLELPSLFDRIVIRGRGGYCFEQNGLLYEILEELGFNVALYLARVVYTRAPSPGLTHRMTLVDIDHSRYLVDVGFGPLGPRGPVSMSGTDMPQAHGIFRISEERKGEFHLQTIKGGDYYSLYRFDLARYGQGDCELGHFYSHKHDRAVFVNNLVASRILVGEIRSLRNRDYRVISGGAESVRELSSADELHSILTGEFGLRVTGAESSRLFAATR